MRLVASLFFIGILSHTTELFATSVVSPTPVANPTPTTQTTPATLAPQTLNINWIDKSIDPAKDFYTFANGKWMQAHPIPAAYPSWSNFNIVQERNEAIIKDIVEAAANNPHNKPGSIAQKVGDFYYSGMNVARINQEGITQLLPEFKRIEQIKNLTELQQVIAHLQLIGVDAVFGFDHMQDFKDSTKEIAVVGQSGIDLPDRDYYLKNDASFVKIRQAYLAHITKMFELLGDQPDTAAANAKTVLQLETALAQASMSRTEAREPAATYHIMDLTQLAQITPNFSWPLFFADMGRPGLKSLNLAMPNFFKEFNAQLAKLPLASWKTYLRWQLITAYAPYLSEPFVQQNFKMVSILSGVQELKPRWKRVLRAEEGALGFAIGKLYVEKAFSPQAKQKAQELIKNIRATLQNDLQHLTWMTPATRQAALKKLAMMENRVGYPDKWRDYSALEIDRGSYVLNIMRANQFLNRYELNKIGKPVDRNEWSMPPQAVDAYYAPLLNSLNIPAGILQPPFFDANAPDTVNYGAIGIVIGHEMTHGFDDKGAKFDGYGNLRNWWSAEDLKKFEQQTQCLAKQFSNYTVLGDLHLQGQLVVGEAAADLGGMMLSYRALLKTPAYQQATTLDGYTPAQQFFLSSAHIWATNIRPEYARNSVITDPHPPAIYRVNGSFANIPEFQQAFAIKAPSPMVNTPRCVIW